MIKTTTTTTTAATVASDHADVDDDGDSDNPRHCLSDLGYGLLDSKSGIRDCRRSS